MLPFWSIQWNISAAPVKILIHLRRCGRYILASIMKD
jgi:hypothetical protein